MSATITRVMEIKLVVVQRDELRTLDPSVQSVLDQLHGAMPGIYAAGWKVQRQWRQAANDVLRESADLVREEIEP